MTNSNYKPSNSIKMKKALFICVIALLSMTLQAQTPLKVHSNGILSLQSSTTTGGVQFQTNGFTSFEPAITTAYGKMEQAIPAVSSSKCWVVYNNSASNVLPHGEVFYVTGTGGVYYYNLYSLQNQIRTRSLEPIGNASQLIGQMNGYYSDSEEFSGNSEDLIDNEYVSPEAVEGLLNDMEKGRSVIMDAEELEAILPEAVRHTTEGNMGINYNALVAVLIEAFKEQQARIDSLEAILEENGLMRK